MKEFLQVLRRFVPPYKKYLALSIAFNILSAILNIFSFAALIPILQILFQVDGGIRANEYMSWDGSLGSLKEVATNNMYYYIQEFIVEYSASTALLVIGLFLAFMTFLKTGAYFLSSAMIIPIRTGIVRDIRNQLYHKITSLSLGFFSEERKGDIIARMSGDVQEVENSIMSSLDMLFKNPILIVAYFTALVVISWQLTIFTILFVPGFGWFMGIVGRKLKAQSTEAQSLWSDTMSMVEETLGGLRIIKAFCAENKMNVAFAKVNGLYRDHHACQHTSADGAPYERVLRHHTHRHRTVVWWNPRSRLWSYRWSYHHLLSRHALQHHQPTERVLEGKLQHP